eukprot:2327001-Prymnesium_polylepis.1
MVASVGARGVPLRVSCSMSACVPFWSSYNVSSLAWAPPLSLPDWARCAAARDRDAPQHGSF